MVFFQVRSRENEMTVGKVTNLGWKLLSDIANQRFTFFDDGVVAHSGIWSDVLTDEAGDSIASNARGTMRVVTGLVKRGMLYTNFEADATNGRPGTWIALTEKGALKCQEILVWEQENPEEVQN